MNWLLIVTLVACTASAWMLTAAMRSYALSAALLDHPNERSSHTRPTPRGGGVSIVVIFLGAVAALWLSGHMSLRVAASLLGSGSLVAVVGFIDDRRPLAARWRFLAHLGAAAWSLWLMQGVPPVPILWNLIDLGFFGTLLAMLYLVWMINLFNFMDGIDGIASIEAISVSLGGALICWLVLPGDAWQLPTLFASCVAGFLIWNFPPAKIFMGDAGSGFVGLMIGLMAVWASQQAPHLFWSLFILVGCFMVDATTTLVRRVRRGEKFNEAHRSHAFQYASRVHGSHRIITMSVGAINIVWLLPMALLVALQKLDGVAGVAIAYAPLVWIAFKYKAGDPAAQEI